MFLDEAEIEVIAGSGGHGSKSFRREKFVPRGGPDGGSGGKGGDVILIGDASLSTLFDFRYRTRYRAERGADGAGGLKDGARGKDCIIRVPCGTVVYDASTGETLGEITLDGQKLLVAAGGKGGRGNAAFATSVRQAPRFAERGEPGERKCLKLELKLIADVGIVGLPNAGKSTLISAISAARPKIADYPFTTLVPNLGVVAAGDSSFVVADMPGLIEGAHHGAGLGHRFLRHIERTRVLLHLVDCLPTDGSDPWRNLCTVEEELREYGHGLPEKPCLIGFNKVDLPGAREVAEKLCERVLKERPGTPALALSAATGEGTRELVYKLLELLQRHPRAMPEPEAPAITPADRARSSDDWTVRRVDGQLRVEGRGIDRLLARTDLDSHEALQYLHRRLEKLGVLQALREQGVQEGETVLVGGVEMEYVETP